MEPLKQHNLFHFRWSVPILSEIFHQDGARFVTILNRLRLSRSVLSSTLGKLVDAGLIIRNPGHGHPLRPEYLLTHEGSKVAPFCKELMKCVREHKGGRLVQSRWALPILFLSNKGGIRFSELISRLRPITPRALSEELKLLSFEGYIKRKIVDGYPPATIYELTPKSKPYIELLTKHKESIPGFSILSQFNS